MVHGIVDEKALDKRMAGKYNMSCPKTRVFSG